MTNLDVTELSCVNEILTAVGYGEVSSVSQTRDASQALKVLNSESATVQSEGWGFNLEYDYVLTAAGGGTLTMENDMLWAYPVDKSKRFALRGQAFIDLKDNTTTSFSGDYKMVVCRFLNVENCPRPARDYIVARAARVFQDRFLGSPDIGNRLSRDEGMARERLIGHEGDAQAYTAFDNISTAQIRAGRGFPIYSELQ